MIRLSLVGLIGLGLAGCGVKAPPEPYVDVIKRKTAETRKPDSRPTDHTPPNSEEESE